MKTQTKLLTGLLSGVAILHAPNVFAQLTLEQIQRKDATARAQVYQELQPQTLTNPDDFVVALATGVRDSSANVRSAASTKAVYVMLALQKAKREKRPLPVNVTGLDSLRAALSEALIDPDAKVRVAAAAALIYSGAPNREIEQTLLRGIEGETNAEIRVSMAKDMALAGYQSPAVEAVLLEALDNPDKKIRERAARAIGLVKPKQGLINLAKRLDDAEMVRDFVVEAIAAYGKEATPYLPELNRLRADKKIGGTLPHRVDKAIEAISSAQSQAPTTDQRPKPVDLDRN
jgi:hypothetical protein